MLSTLLAGFCLSGAEACSEQPALGPVIDAASSHLATFERFERWAQRSVESDVRMRGVQALRETLFAPLRRDRSVLWAEVQSEDGRVLPYRTPFAGAELSFVPIETAALGRVLVAVCAECKQPGQSACVVIERSKARRATRVRMGFCKVDAEPQVSAAEGRRRSR
ncbi:MAG TPA: hypothetical protein VFN67_27910 [Polyangiales bacterium]|nr:hypothetical protein [Polyangiales bacterium]